VSAYWAEHAWLSTGLAADVRFEVVDGRFAAVHPRARPRDGDERLRGVVLPGLANGHSHAFHRALRGRTHGDGGNFWTWRQQMYAVTRRLDPETYFSLARAAFAEMALSGYTAVGEFHYLHHDAAGDPYADPNAMGHALAQAGADAGIRLTLLDTCYLAADVDGRPVEGVQRRFSDGSVDAWAERVAALHDGPGLRIGVAAHSVRAVPRPALHVVAEAARFGATVPDLVYGPDVIAVARETGRTIPEVAHAFFLVGERLYLNTVEQRVSRQPATTRWQRMAWRSQLDDLRLLRRQIVAHVIEGAGTAGIETALDDYLAARSDPYERLTALVGNTAGGQVDDASAVMVMVHQIRQVVA